MKELVFITLFPEQINFYMNCSIPLQAQKKEKIKITTINIRENNKEQIDDYAFGGGGMVIKAQPIIDQLIKNNLINEHIILLSPRGKTISQKEVMRISKIEKKIVFICGHYEGIDERIMDYVSEEISMGDFILSSGEIAALVLADAIIRVIPGVINPLSLITESFEDGLLDHPQYTRPADLNGKKVPDILLSGHHEEIKKYRLQERIRLTRKHRPDLYEEYLKNKK